jgi:hypothetical protein
VAGKTIRGVVYGILGTALVQAVLVGIGLFIAGVPGAALLALLTFFFSVVPVIGTGLVWIPAAFWLFHQGSTGWAIFMAIWGLGVGNIDNFIKPWLISQGSDMPFILVFFGVIGGALTFGFVGVFLGPTLLAVGWRLVEEWASTPGPPGSAKSATEALPQAALRDPAVTDPEALRQQTALGSLTGARSAEQHETRLQPWLLTLLRFVPESKSNVLFDSQWILEWMFLRPFLAGPNTPN